MPEQVNPHVENPDVSYEKSDAHVGPILAFAAGLALFLVIAHVALALLFVDFKSSASTRCWAK